MAASGLMPEEMVVQILARLHPKSLMRFKCVRKSWYALINDPQFVSKHPHSYNDVSSTRILLKRTMAKETETTKEEVASTYNYVSSTRILLKRTMAKETETSEGASTFLDLPNDSDGDFDNLDSAIED